MALHEQSVGATSEWYTPSYIFEALSPIRFDTDVAHPAAISTYVPATEFITADSLALEWRGFVWMNPPFGPRNGIAPWLRKFAEHGNGIALTPDRTSAPWWQTYASKMDAILFVSPKIKFLDTKLCPGRSPAQGTTLMAIGSRGVAGLKNAARNGLGLLMVNSGENE